MKLVLYIHGKNGNTEEANHYKSLFPLCEVEGLEYKRYTPWETGREIHDAVLEFAAMKNSEALQKAIGYKPTKMYFQGNGTNQWNVLYDKK